MGKYSDMFLSPDTETPAPQKTMKWADAYLSPDVQREFTPTSEIDTRTSQPVKKFTPTSEKSTGLGTLIKSGFVDDTQTKINIFAKGRGISPDRYRVLNGEIIYQGDDGGWYPETKQTPSARLKQFAGETIANSPSIVMGTVGAAGGLIPAAIGAAGGEGIRKSVGSLIFKEPQTVSGNLTDMGTVGVLGAGSELLMGKGSTSLINRAGRARGGKLVQAAGRGAADIDVAATKELEQLGTSHGIKLYPPQTTGSKKLIDKFNLLGDIDASADIIQGARTKQAGEVENAVYKFFKDLSPSKDTTSETGGKLVDASKKALQRPVDIRRAKASPIYEKAFTKKNNIDVSEAIKEIRSLMGETVPKDPSSIVLKRIESMIESASGDLRKLHRVKTRGIDAVLNKSQSDNVLRREMKIVKDKLVDAMDKASPDYATARKIFSDYSEEITKQSRKTILGDISKLEGDKVTGAVKKLFASPEVKKSPEIVTRVKAEITRQNPEVWNKAIVDHLQGLFESTKESATGGITNKGGHFYKKVWGDTGQRKVLEAAMDKQQFQSLSNFMKVLERTGMILGKESATATRQLALEEMKRAGQSKFIMASTRPLYTYQRIIGDYLNEVMMGKSSKNLAEIMVSKRAAEQLNRMVQLKPNSEKLIRQFATFFGLTTGGAARRSAARLMTPDTKTR